MSVRAPPNAKIRNPKKRLSFSNSLSGRRFFRVGQKLLQCSMRNEVNEAET